MSKLNPKSVLVGITVGALLLAAAPVVADIGDPLLQGQRNVTDARTTMRGSAPGANLRIIQQHPDSPALTVFTEPGVAPMKVNRRAKVANLNSDLLDGRSSEFFAPKVPRFGDTMAGAWAGRGVSTFFHIPVTFSPALAFGIPNANIHYLGTTDAPTKECPGAPNAAPGHLCIYTAFSNSVSFSQILGIESSFSDADATPHGFVIAMTSSDPLGNARGTWAYTVPAAAPDFPTGPAEGTPDSDVSSG